MADVMIFVACMLIGMVAGLTVYYGLQGYKE